MIYTRTGDKGTTSLLDGSRVRKDSTRVESYGTIDELNSLLGFAKNFVADDEMRMRLNTIQKELFAVAGELADPTGKKYPSHITGEHVTRFEQWIDGYVAQMDPAPKFIVPGSNKASAVLHMARTVCRRAERIMVSLDAQEPVNPFVMKYVNRLSDVLYTFARFSEEKQQLVDAKTTADL